MHADDVLGLAAAPASDVTGMELVFVASTVSAPAELRQLGEQLALELGPLGRCLDDEVARGQVVERGGGASRCAAVASTRPFATQRSSPSRTRRSPASSASSRGSWRRVR